mgnify:FL=1
MERPKPGQKPLPGDLPEGPAFVVKATDNDLKGYILSRRPEAPSIYPGVYRNAEGSKVLGAGVWIPSLGVGIITEIQYSEVYNPYASGLWTILKPTMIFTVSPGTTR